MKKLNVLLMKLETKRSSPANIASQDDYYRKVVERITLNSQKKKGEISGIFTSDTGPDQDHA